MRLASFIIAIAVLTASSAFSGSINTAIDAFNKKKFKKAFDTFELHAMKGDAQAQYYTGMMFQGGKGRTKSAEKAKWWYEKAIEQDSLEAVYALGSMLFFGEGIAPDTSRGMELMEKSAESGNKDAQLLLGKLFLSGKGVEKDEDKAKKWLEMAAEGGMSDAQHRLGLILFVKDERVTAFKWLSLAAKSGNKDAKKVLKKVKPAMTKDQLKEAESEIKSFKPTA